MACAHLGLQKPHVAQLLQEACCVVGCGLDAEANSLGGQCSASHWLWPWQVPVTSVGFSLLLCDGGTQA